MVRLLTSLLYWGSIAVIVVLDIVLWFEGWVLGLLGILGLIVFPVAYAYSVEMSIAPRDFWVNPEFEIVKKKLKYAWTAAMSTIFVPIILYVAIFGA